MEEPSRTFLYKGKEKKGSVLDFGRCGGGLGALASIRSRSRRDAGEVPTSSLERLNSHRLDGERSPPRDGRLRVSHTPHPGPLPVEGRGNREARRRKEWSLGPRLCLLERRSLEPTPGGSVQLGTRNSKLGPSLASAASRVQSDFCARRPILSNRRGRRRGRRAGSTDLPE